MHDQKQGHGKMSIAGGRVAGSGSGEGKHAREVCVGAEGWIGYEGEWRSDLRHGKGRMVWGPEEEAGCSYEGEVSFFFFSFLFFFWLLL